MAPLNIERRVAATRAERAADVARHLFTRSAAGKAIIVVDQPIVFLSALKKHWNKLYRRVLRARSATLDAVKILALTQELARLDGLIFGVKDDDRLVDVLVVAPGSLPVRASFATVYLCANTEASQLESLLAGLMSNAVVVDYVGAYNGS